MAPKPQAIPQPPRLEREPSVVARTGRSKSSIRRDVAAGTFPAPVKIGERAVAWDAAAVDTWIAQRLADAAKDEAATK